MDLGTRATRVVPRRRWPYVAAVGLVLGAIPVGVLLVRDDDTSGVVLEPAGAVSDDAYFADLAAESPTETVRLVSGDEGGGADEPEMEPLDDPVLLAGLRVDGGAPGLYTARRDEQVCDLAGLRERLLGDEPSERADDWFAALGRGNHDAGKRRRYVDRLTAVRLRFDTRVTVHTTREPYPAVLQAGTAVLVDLNGVPRVKCAGGAPLTEPDVAAGVAHDRAVDVAHAADPDAAWDGFDPAAVVVVEKGPALEAIDLVDPSDGELFTRPRGTDGERDRRRYVPSDADPCEKGCPELRISVETLEGTPAEIAYLGGLKTPARLGSTGLVWRSGRPRPDTIVYEVFHTRVIYKEVDRDADLDNPLYWNDPRYEGEDLTLEFPPELWGRGVIYECVPGDVRITITVDDVEVQSTTEHVPCIGETKFSYSAE